jgi:uncharacterized protein YjiS (DUF1127 family)
MAIAHDLASSVFHLAPRRAAMRLADLILLWLERGRQRRELAALTDRELRDIGLSRLDVARETAKPFWHA